MRSEIEGMGGTWTTPSQPRSGSTRFVKHKSLTEHTRNV